MKLFDFLEETYLALSANKARSGLTVLGIVIGISSVIAMLAIGTGAVLRADKETAQSVRTHFRKGNVGFSNGVAGYLALTLAMREHFGH